MATRKASIRINPRTRQAEKVPVKPPQTGKEDLPAPEPIRLSPDLVKGKSANGTKPSEPQAPTDMVKLDLACGQSPKEGFEGVDFYAPNAKHKVDLFRFPWPFEDSSVDAIHCSHFIEHIPMVYVKGGEVSMIGGAGFKELFFAFFDECYRIIKHDGVMHVICPSVRSERAFQDPTHHRFISQATFFYLSKLWREQNKLDHYNVKCNFSGNANFSFPIELQGRHDEVRNELFAHAWNSIFDYMVDLKAIK